MQSPVLQAAPSSAPTLSRVLRHPVTDVLVMVLILASVALLVVEEVYELPPDSPVAVVSDLITGLFVIELTLRFIAARKKRRFFRRYWTDILAVLPLFRPLRFFRLLRLFRLFRLFQLGLILDRRFTALRGVLRVNFPFLWIMLVITGLAVVGATVLAFSLERRASTSFDTLPHSFWWVTYSLIAGEPIGDMPNTVPGRFLLVGIMLGGSALFAAFTGIVSATMVDRLSVMKSAGEMDLDELEGHIVVCGWNAGAIPMLSELAADRALKDLPLVLVNELERLPSEAVNGLEADLVYHLHGDFAQLERLKQAGVDRASRAIVLADDCGLHNSVDRDARSVLTALTIERLNRKIHCVVELNHEANQAHLGVAGVEAVVTGSDLTGRALAAACRSSTTTIAIMDLLSLRTGSRLERRPGPRESMPFQDLMARVKAQENLLVIGIDRPGQGCTLNPPADLVVHPTDHVVVIL